MQSRRTEETAAVAMRCACGHGIFCGLEPKGVRLGLLAYLDEEPSSSTYGERIEHCPSCGKRLAIHNLLTKKSPEG